MATILLLLPTRTYRSGAFLAAARRLSLDIVVGAERPSVFAPALPDHHLALDFNVPARAVEHARMFACRHKLDAVVGVDDATSVLAAHIAAALGLPHTPVQAATLAHEKHLMRARLDQTGVRVPRFSLRAMSDDPARLPTDARYPAVIKPLILSGSRGVIRADDALGLTRALGRLDAILRSPDLAGAGEAARHCLIEDFVAGPEVALEGLLIGGAMHVLALFDKPDPLDGPFFEETIYVTPSRLAEDIQERIISEAARAAQGLGLRDGPIHAELRVGRKGPVVIELAARSIGGLCSRTLRFTGGDTLEELILRHAVGLSTAAPRREVLASGVMMMPIRAAGVLREVRGIDRARAVPFIEDVVITAHPGQTLVPLPEGASYPGFIFARAPTPAQVEAALRTAHAFIEFELERSKGGSPASALAGTCGSAT